MEKARKMSQRYAYIIYKRNSGYHEVERRGGSQTRRPKRNQVLNLKADRTFYETLYIFTAKVLQGAFDREDLPKLEVELNRLFRTNAFNIAQRRQFNE